MFVSWNGIKTRLFPVNIPIFFFQGPGPMVSHLIMYGRKVRYKIIRKFFFFFWVFGPFVVSKRLDI
jgi:hypothetical protein